MFCRPKGKSGKAFSRAIKCGRPRKRLPAKFFRDGGQRTEDIQLTHLPLPTTPARFFLLILKKKRNSRLIPIVLVGGESFGKNRAAADKQKSAGRENQNSPRPSVSAVVKTLTSTEIKKEKTGQTRFYKTFPSFPARCRPS
jgi:hypothetical protein